MKERKKERKREGEKRQYRSEPNMHKIDREKERERRVYIWRRLRDAQSLVKLKYVVRVYARLCGASLPPNRQTGRQTDNQARSIAKPPQQAFPSF